MDKIIAFVAVAQNLYSRWLFRRVVSSLIGIAALTIITSMLAGTVLIGGFYAAYLALLHAGADPQLAAYGIIGLLAAAAILFMLFTLNALNRLRTMPRRMLKEKAPQVSQAGEVVEAFMDGLMGRRK